MGLFDWFKNNKDQADKLDRENSTTLQNIAALNKQIIASLQMEKMAEASQAAMEANLEKLKEEGRGV